MKVALVGTGLVGRAWGICFARGGHDVVYFNRNRERAEAAIAYAGEILPDLEQMDLLNGFTASQVRSRLQPAERLEDALAGAHYVQESLPEDASLKRDIFLEMEAAVDPDCVLASSTSGIVASAFTRDLKHRERCVIAHPLNPPFVIPAVDLVPSPWTSNTVLDWTAEFLRGCGQAPIHMKKEDPGFLTIRLQGAIYHEAFRLVAEGFADPEDVDICIRDGLGLRWSFIGPFETADLNAPGGIREFVGLFGDSYRDLYPKDGPIAWAGALLDEVEQARRSKLAMSDHPARQLWRDRRLVSLVAHKRAQARRDCDNDG